MNKVLLYLISFVMAFILMLVIFHVVFFVLLAVVSFITWSPPIVFPYNWFIFRLLAAFAVVSSIFWSFSKENKEWVEGVLEDMTSNEKL
jgi:hypothetical protein